ncbi:DUF614 domain protein [Aspergillus glaucus CBS 516.65]|uniref:DUF614 domain protein n=1 Tax=Aspergillus glaucus CBS 516.65 TaxID=1160497 RepID=A0A1L9V8W5_ASPGL|nr:hypothetical protein ASPGLDRAFT_69443 [Aspergillus glaucus CBS 516.65]OJJ80343.1 hypothetical protein ASPGLDRAFT_69443 [Aspergillus glaucus CBS 516.65]
MNRQLRLDTNNVNRRYSFLQTPLEMHAPGYQPAAAVDPTQHQQRMQEQQEQPQEPEQTVSRHVSQQSPNLVNEKTQYLQNDSVASPYTSGSPPPPEQHPANYAPFADEMIQPHPQPPVQPQPPSVEAPQYVQDPTPRSPGPLPLKTDQTPPEQNPNSRPLAVAPDTNPLHSPQFPRFPPPTATSTGQVAVPEDVAAYHQPGQVKHPNQEIKGGTWSHSMCDCSNISTCCLGIFCPCILYGKTQYRLTLKSRKEDPTNLLGYSACNGSCTAMALLCGCQWLLATIQHKRTRKAYSIRGDIGSDCVRATCCTCCTLIQDETEIKKREEDRTKIAAAQGATLMSPYTAPAPMSYPPPPR